VSDEKPRNKNAVLARAPADPNWSVRRFRHGSLVGPVSVLLSFPTEGGGVAKIVAPYSDLRNQRKFLDNLSNHMPIFPERIGSTDKARFTFITELVTGRSDGFELIPEKTGFIDAGTFATYSEVIYADGRRQPIPLLNSSAVPMVVDVRGTADGATKVLKLARHSSYLAFGIGVALASPLPSYLKFRRDGEESSQLPETAVFNLSGRSSSGKTSVALASISLAGSPERAGTLDFTARGLAEAAKDNNDLLLVLDDTEKAEHGQGVLVKALKSIVHTVPGGRSKIISRGVDQGKFPQLRWSTFGLSSSPRSLAALAADNSWTMTPGDQVRLFNIDVPSSKKGGIFDLIDGSAAKRAKRSVELIAKLERGYQNHHGHVMPQWVLHLMSEDRSERVLALVERFVHRVDAGDDGWEVRFAQKFGYVYAAMVMAIEAGVLPWGKALPLKVAKRCYRRARKAVTTVHQQFIGQAGRLGRLMQKSGRIVNSKGADGAAVVINQQCVAIRYWKEGREKLGVFDEALIKLLGTPAAKVSFTKELASAGLIHGGHGHAGTVQERIRIERDGEIADRVRVWSLDAEKFARFLKKNGNSWCLAARRR